MSESFDKAVEAASEAIAGQHWRTAMDDALAALRAALPHLTAQDVPHVAREARDEGYSSGVNDARIADSTPIDFGFGETYIEPCRANPYAEEANPYAEETAG